jgi:hypothetical protein
MHALVSSEALKFSTELYVCFVSFRNAEIEKLILIKYFMQILFRPLRLSHAQRNQIWNSCIEILEATAKLMCRKDYITHVVPTFFPSFSGTFA